MPNEFTLRVNAASTKPGAAIATTDLSGTFSPGYDADNGVTQNVLAVAGGSNAAVLDINVDITPASDIGWLIVRNEGIDSTGAATTKKVTLSFKQAVTTDFPAYQFAEIPAGMTYSGRPVFPTGTSNIYVNAETGATNGVQIRKWVASK
jgi:hypothetical protein